MTQPRQAIVLALGPLAAGASALARGTDNLISVPVEPHRIVDARESPAGPVPADVVGVDGDARPFLISGDSATLAVQGGAKTGCLHPKADDGLEPAAIAAYLIAVPAPGSAGGVLDAFPADQPDPGTAFVGDPRSGEPRGGPGHGPSGQPARASGRTWRRWGAWRVRECTDARR